MGKSWLERDWLNLVMRAEAMLVGSRVVSGLVAGGKFAMGMLTLPGTERMWEGRDWTSAVAILNDYNN